MLPLLLPSARWLQCKYNERSYVAADHCCACSESEPSAPPILVLRNRPRPLLPFPTPILLNARRPLCSVRSEDDFSGPLDQVLREFTLEGPRPTVHQLDTLTEALGEQLPSVKLYATAFFIKHGFYYTGLKVALPDPALRRALLEALRPMVRSSDGGKPHG